MQGLVSTAPGGDDGTDGLHGPGSMDEDQLLSRFSGKADAQPLAQKEFLKYLAEVSGGFRWVGRRVPNRSDHKFRFQI